MAVVLGVVAAFYGRSSQPKGSSPGTCVHRVVEFWLWLAESSLLSGRVETLPGDW